MCPSMIQTRIPNGTSIVLYSQSYCCLTTYYRNDILRKHKIIPEKAPSPTPIIQEAILEAQKRAYENRLEDKDLDELKELEDEEDDAFLAKYRSVQWQPMTGIVC